MIQAIIFDFDGVILESVDLKGRAFSRLFHAWPEHLDAIERLHRDNGGLSRYEKFRRIHEDFLRRPLPDAEVWRLDAEFGEFVGAEILTCPFVPGALEFLERRVIDHRLFVASGAPQDELRTILAARGLSQFFAGAYGSPRSKHAIVREILTELGEAGGETIFIGDARQDYEAAAAAGVPFVGRVAPGSPSPFPGTPVAIVRDLTELNGMWTALVRQLESRVDTARP